MIARLSWSLRTSMWWSATAPLTAPRFTSTRPRIQQCCARSWRSPDMIRSSNGYFQSRPDLRYLRRQMSVRWHTYPDAQATAQACAHHIARILEEVLSGQDHASVAISGGSTPALMFRELVASGFGWDRVHLFWVDERCVPPGDTLSNYGHAEHGLILPAHIPQRQVHRIYGELLPSHAAERYTEEIREFFALEQGELPHFDIVHRG